MLCAGASAVISGEPEVTLAELVGVWTDGGGELDAVRGLVLPGNGAAGFLRVGPRPFIQELDALPFPAWDLIDVPRYREAWGRAHGRLSWNMVTSRGCPYGCNWCAKPMFGRGYAQRSPASVADELRSLRDAVGPDHVWFADDIFRSEEHTSELQSHSDLVCRLLLEKKKKKKIIYITQICSSNNE